MSTVPDITSEQLQSLAGLLPALKTLLTDGPDLTDDMWSVDHIGRFMGWDRRYVMDNIAPLNGFPRAIRVIGTKGSKSARRWKRNEVVAWLERQRE